MEIVRHISKFPKNLRGAVAALGNFDGFHRGHQVVVGEAGRIAYKEKHPLMVIMTEPHPRSFFNPKGEHFRLTPFRERLNLLEDFGVDIAVVLPFNQELANHTPEEFAQEILADGLRISHAVVGYDYRFGQGRAGDVKVLQNLGCKYGFEVSTIPQVPIGVEGAVGEPYSSTLVRKALKEREARKAAALLGHWWTVNGLVLEGEKRGQQTGFPTANLEFHDSIIPGHGVYAVRCNIEGEKNLFSGIANVGIRPTFGGGRVFLEVHLFNFQGNLYHKHLRVHLVGGIRAEKKFDGIDALKAQIRKDCKAARNLLEDPENAHDHLKPPTLKDYLKFHPKAAI